MASRCVIHDLLGKPRSAASRRATGRAGAIAAAASSAWLSRQSASVRATLLAQAVARSFARGECIAGLDEQGSELFFLAQGSVQAAIARADGEVVVTHVISPGEWFGEYGVASKRGNITEYRATTPSVLLAIPRAALGRLHEAAAQGAIIDLLLDALKTYVEMAGGLTGLRAEQRVRSKLHALAGGAPANPDGTAVLRISQDDLADVSCVSRSVVSKVIAQLTSDGVVQVGYRRIVIIDRDGLMLPSDNGKLVRTLRSVMRGEQG